MSRIRSSASTAATGFTVAAASTLNALAVTTSTGTETLARAIAASKAFSIAGGGDTLAAIAKYGIEKDIGYISTGGGAFLEMLEGKTLPAIEILERRARDPQGS